MGDMWRGPGRPKKKAFEKVRRVEGLKDEQAQVILDTHRHADGSYTPVVHVLKHDGQVAEFKDVSLLVTSEHYRSEKAPFAVIYDGDGNVCLDKNGEPLTVAIPVMTLQLAKGPVTYKELADHAGVSLSTVKRAVKNGELKEPTRVGKRAVRFDPSEVNAWLAKNAMKKAVG